MSGHARVKNDEKIRCRRALYVCGAIVLLATGALAQDAGSLLREQQRQQELQRLERLPEPEEVGPAKSLITGPEEGETIVVRQVLFTGKVELLPEMERARIAESVKGKRLGIMGIKTIADEVTIAIQKRGRMLGYAVLPPQDITEGTVTIRILEGRLEKTEFERKDGVRVREGLLSQIAGNIVRSDGVDKRDLEEALLRMNDLPGVAARAKLAPGAAPRTSRLIVGVEQQPVFSASVGGDNYGSASTGLAQGNASVTLTDLTGYGDLTGVAGTFSEGQTFGRATFSVPLGASPFTVNANYGYLAYRNIDDLGSTLGLEGYAHYAGTGLNYSLIRSRKLNVQLSGGLNWKALVDESIAGRLQDKRSLSGTFGINGDMRDDLAGGGLTSWSLAWTWGDLDLSRVESALAADEASLQTQGQFHRLNTQIARLQKLPGDLSLFGRLYGQWASKNLDSSEDFALGGPYGVRGYPVGEGQGDMGLLATIELRYDVPAPPEIGTLQLAAFVDAGRIWTNKDPDGITAVNECGCNAYNLAGAGISARWIRNNLSFSATYAHALGSNPGRSVVGGENVDGTDNDHQFWLQGAIRF